MYGVKPQVNHLRVFGCTAYAHIAKDERRSMQKARRCILLGYGHETKGYRLYDIELKRVLHSHDVTFNETASRIVEDQFDQVCEKPLFELRLQDDSPNKDEQISDVEQEELQQETDESSQVPTLRQSQRVQHPPEYYGIWVNSVEGHSPEPTSIEEALSSAKQEEWKKAISTEMESINENDIWELVELPENKQVIGCKWVFKRKLRANGSVEHYKAHLVAQGFSQHFGVDYDKTFRPVVQFESLCTLITVAVQNGLKFIKWM